MSEDMQKRVARAQRALDAYKDGSDWGSEDEWIGDLLADLMHYVDSISLDEDFDDLLATARNHHFHEVSENNQKGTN